MTEVARSAPIEGSEDRDPFCLIAMDKEKAYPNTSRSMADEVFRRLGCPAEFERKLSALYAAIESFMKTAMGASNP